MRDLEVPPNVNIFANPDDVVIVVTAPAVVVEEEEVEEEMVAEGEEPEVIEHGKAEEEGEE